MSEPPVFYSFQKKFLEDKSRFREWLGARQTSGKSFTLSFDAPMKAMETLEDVTVLSASQFQTNQFFRKIKNHLRVIKKLVKTYSFDEQVLSTKETARIIEFKSGPLILLLPANPLTAQGFTGHLYCDEIAWFRDPRAIWGAVFPTITRRNLSATIASTPNGRNFFYTLWKNPIFSKHKTTIHDAIAAGVDINVAELRQGLSDPELFAQYYECEFIDELTALIPWDWIERAVTDSIISEGDLYLGMDIGRKRHLSVIALFAKVGDVLWLNDLIVLERTSFRRQREVLFDLLKNPRLRRACIDATGLGMQFAEEAQDAFGKYKVEAVTFTPTTKEELAMTLFRSFDDRTIRIPDDPKLKEDLHSIKKYITSSKNVRFEADETDLGHADRFWACALANHAAAGQQVVMPKPVGAARKRDWEWEKYDEDSRLWRTYH